MMTCRSLRYFLAFVLLMACTGSAAEQNPSQAAQSTARPGPVSLRVMSYNVQRADLYAWKKWRLQKTIEAVKTANADVVGLQEVMKIEHLQEVLQGLGWKHGILGGDGGPGLVSKHPFESSSKGRFGVAARIKLPGGKVANIVNVHIPLQPNWRVYYLPYAAADKKHTEEQLVQLGKANWDENLWPKALNVSIQDVEKVIKPIIASGEPLFLTGDFNEPSHLDWTEAAFKAGIRPMKVNMPLSNRLADIGFKDSYRTVHPNEVKHPGHTWTPRSDRIHDRIDFVLYQGQGVKTTSSQIVGEMKNKADLVVRPWPSDHRAVVSEFLIK